MADTNTNEERPQSEVVLELVDRLEEHLYADEREFTRLLRISEDKTDEELDQLFLMADSGNMNDDTFNRCHVLRQLSVTNLIQDVKGKNEDDSTEDAQDSYLKQLEKAKSRLKEYLETLTNQIV